MSVDVDTVAAALARADAEEFRAEGPRIDNRVNTLVSLVLGGVASAGVLGGVGGSVSREHHAPLAHGLFAVSAVVIVAGLVLQVRLILPKLSRRVTPRSGALARVSVLPDDVAVRDYYRAAARTCLAYQSASALRHARGIAARLHRFRTAGYVVTAGVLLAAAGFLALGWGW